MAGLTVRQLVLENVLTVAAHARVPAISRAAAATLATRLSAHTTSTMDDSNKKKKDEDSDSKPMRQSLLERMLIRRGSKRTSSSSSNSHSSGGGGGFALMTEEEVAWLAQQRRERDERRRIVLATRPTCSLTRACVGAASNLVVGAVGCPFVWFAVSLEKARTMPWLARVTLAPLYGTAWSAIFVSAALYAALQQVVLAVYYGYVCRPLCYCLARHAFVKAKTIAATTTTTATAALQVRSRARQWGVLACRFEQVEGTAGYTHPLLQHYDSDAAVRERAARRLARRLRERGEYYGVESATRNNSSTAQHGDDGNSRRTDYTRRDGGAADRHRNSNNSSNEEDYYKLLGVSRDASARAIKEAYNALVMQLHPDRNASPHAAAQFDKVTRAYRVLSNPQQRRRYNAGGAAAVDSADMGARKREAVCGLFGGDVLRALVGDVLTGSLAYRIIDDMDTTQEDVAVLRQRMYERARDELLLRYLALYKTRSSSSSSDKEGPRDVDTAAGNDAVLQRRLRAVAGVGLAREVLYIVGHEYLRVLHCHDMQFATPSRNKKDDNNDNNNAVHEIDLRRRVTLPTLVCRRASYFMCALGPHRARALRRWLACLARIRQRTFRDPRALIDVAWYTGAREVERMARATAFAVLYDASLTSAELLRRRVALAALAQLFVQHGRAYAGANASTVATLTESLREYQRQRERERREGGGNRSHNDTATTA